MKTPVQGSAVETNPLPVQIEHRADGWTRTSINVLLEHRRILCCAAAYLVVGGAFQLALGRPWPLRPTTPWFASAWLTATGAYFLAKAVMDWRRTRRDLTAHRVASAVLVAALVVPVQITFQSVKQSLGPVLGFRWDRPLSDLDRLLHAGPAWRVFEPFMTQSFVRMLDVLYIMWFPLLIVFIAWCCWTTHRTLRERAILAWLLLWIGGGTVGAWLMSSGGPVYYAGIVGQPEPAYVELIDRLDALDIQIARKNHRGIWDMNQEDRWGPFGGISAMPSMHVAVVALIAMAAWRRWRPAGMAMWVFALLTQVGSVVLAWHYAIDGYVGVLLAWASWVLAGRWVGEGSDWSPATDADAQGTSY
jgi:hypothetical protein